MNETDFARARESLTAAKDSTAKTKLLQALSHCEHLSTGTDRALQIVGQNTASVTEFYDALVELRQILETAYAMLTELDKEILKQCISSEITYSLAQPVMAVIRVQSRELNELYWGLPHRQRVVSPPTVEPEG